MRFIVTGFDSKRKFLLNVDTDTDSKSDFAGHSIIVFVHRAFEIVLHTLPFM